MNFDEIELERQRQDRSVTELTRTAGLSRSTYKFIRTGKVQPHLRTLRKLATALAAKAPAAAARCVDNIAIPDLYRAYVVILAPELGYSAEQVLNGVDEPGPPRPDCWRPKARRVWRGSAHVRALAIYCVTIELGVSGARVGRAVGLTRAAISQINRRAEDFRDDPKIDELIERVGALVSGRAP